MHLLRFIKSDPDLVLFRGSDPDPGKLPPDPQYNIYIRTLGFVPLRVRAHPLSPCTGS